MAPPLPHNDPPLRLVVLRDRPPPPVQLAFVCGLCWGILLGLPLYWLLVHWGR